MKKETILRFLNALGADMTRMRIRGDWMNVRCPLAHITHTNGDAHPSCGILISDDGPAIYHCFGCSGGKPESLSWMVHTMWVATGRYPTDAAKILASENFVSESDAPVFDWDIRKRLRMTPLDADVLKQYPPLSDSVSCLTAMVVRNWLTECRGLAPSIIDTHGLRYSPENCTVVFPLTDHAGNIFVLQERMIGTKKMWTVNENTSGVHVDYPTIRHAGCWMNLKNADWGRPVMLVESGFDAGRIASLGFDNVIASGGTGVTPAQIGALAGHTYILGYDNDRAGQQAMARIARMLGNHTVYVADWGVVGVKDGGDLVNAEQLKKVLTNTRRMT